MDDKLIMFVFVVLLAGAALFLLYKEDYLMGNLSYDQVRQYAVNAGFGGIDADIATAIAMAESGGNPSAYNPETDFFAARGIDGTNQGSVGLWQIFQYEHPEFAGWNLQDPQQNANAAYQVYQQAGGFSPWSTYKSGAYMAYLGIGSSTSGVA